MTRFFIPSNQIQGDNVVLSGEDRHHLLTVLRKGLGSEIAVLNGKGDEFVVQITETTSDTVVGTIIKKIERSAEPKVKIHLIQSLPKADKFEWILQKNTELGVASFRPVITERSTIRLDAGQARKKEERWRKIIREAAEQSGRQIIPDLAPVQNWNQFLNEKPARLWIIPWEGEREQPIKAVLEKQKEMPNDVAVFIGPEGGFSQNEVNQAIALGAIPVTLGPRILRTETAGLVVASVILYWAGDLG